MPRKKIIIDCDPGIDDAIALAALIGCPDVELVAVTVTHGNVSLERTTQNALDWLSFLGSKAPVFAGCAKPLSRSTIAAADIHGEHGIGGVTLPIAPQVPAAETAAEALVRYANEQPGTITLLATGPLTNVAMALQLESSVLSKFEQVVVMGGSTTEGNTTPAAEFNIFADPHAAQIVFASGAKLTMIGLNATHQVIATPDRVASIRALPTYVSEPLARMMEFYKIAYNRKYDWDGAAIHDLCTAAFALHPAAFKVEPMHVAVDLNEGAEFGRTICSPATSGRALSVVTEVDSRRVFDFLESALLSAPQWRISADAQRT